MLLSRLGVVNRHVTLRRADVASQVVYSSATCTSRVDSVILPRFDSATCPTTSLSRQRLVDVPSHVASRRPLNACTVSEIGKVIELEVEKQNMWGLMQQRAVASGLIERASMNNIFYHLGIEEIQAHLKNLQPKRIRKSNCKFAVVTCNQ
ncbi:hypothetical protein Ddye_017520 [Dipteronia dyeriana]|uniref:Uncharacterized protein n=1 Tax=Dipteronia dyeriana TaxID=168575 RepID=A0AAD9U9C2_9ROSI|nr:hypothetical protein Ddye_017520 [Dipteronia dyeriana]